LGDAPFFFGRRYVLFIKGVTPSSRERGSERREGGDYRKDDMSVREWVASSWSEIERAQMYKRRLLASSLTYYVCACTNTKERREGEGKGGKKNKGKKHPWEIPATEMPRANCQYRPTS
jgi:hypothetical protein